MRLLAVIIAVAITTMPAASTTPAQKPKFEVVSIKPHMPSNPIHSANLSGGRVLINGFTLKMIISRAYGFADTRVFGGQAGLALIASTSPLKQKVQFHPRASHQSFSRC